MNPQPIIEWFFGKCVTHAPLTSKVGEKIYPDAAPANTGNPSVVYQVIDAPGEDVLDVGAVTDGEVAIQLRCYGSTRKSANEVREILRRLFQNMAPDTTDGWRITGAGFGELAETFERETEDYGALAVVVFGVEERVISEQ
jgi:hypothetical protein